MQLRTIASGGSSSAASQGSANAHPGLSFLTDSPSARAFNIFPNGPQQPLTTNTTFALSQLPALRALLAELRPKLVTLQETVLKQDSAKDERREERREYIEQRTKAHLDKSGHALAMNAVSTGRQVDKDEILALEKVSSIFGPS